MNVPPLLAEARRAMRWHDSRTPRYDVPLDVRVFGRVEIVNDCWEFQGSLALGYGKVKFFGKTYAAHRVAYEAVNGPIPEGLFVCHKCDNRRCVNPSHLFVGTASDNNWDRQRKGRTILPPPGPHLGIRQREKTHCVHGHEFTEENTTRDKYGHRRCRTCSRIREARRVRSTEVSISELAELAANAGAPIELPGNRAGWARTEVDGRRYHAFVLGPDAAVAS